MCSRSSAIRCAASARVMKERIAEAARLVCCRSRAGRLYSGRRSHGEVAGGQGVRSQSARCSEGHDRARPGLPGRDLRPPLEPQARHVPARKPPSREVEAEARRAVPARTGEGGGDRRRGAHHRGGRGRQEAARAPLEERRAPGPAPENHRGGAVGGDDHGGERRADDHAGAARRREDLGLLAAAVKVTFWLFVALGFVYAFYVGAVVVYSYYQVTDIVRESVKERAAVDRSERADRIKQDILTKAPESGVPLSERDVRVIEENRTLRVLIRWSYPAIFYKGDAVLSIPLSYEKSFELPNSR